MTRDELDAATDEQLNEMAAKVMGWNEWAEENATRKYPAYLVNEMGRVFSVSDTYDFEEWSPATDIADAWELVEKLRNMKMRVTVVLVGDRTICDVTEPSGRDSRSACHASNTRAITTAALLAWGEKEKA